MAQPTEVMAFRHRLKRRGYTDIRIKKVYVPACPGSIVEVEYYRVSAREPLANVFVSKDFPLYALSYLFTGARTKNIKG